MLSDMSMKKKVLIIISAGVWVTVSEFIRNEFLFKSYWVDQYNLMGLRFETKPINGILWMIWSFILAYIIFKLLQRFSFVQALLTAWLAGFVMMWMTIFNLQVLPIRLLLPAIPLSLLEVAVAELIINRICRRKWFG
jgi:hypothetical protein